MGDKKKKKDKDREKEKSRDRDKERRKKSKKNKEKEKVKEKEKNRDKDKKRSKKEKRKQRSPSSSSSASSSSSSSSDSSVSSSPSRSRQKKNKKKKEVKDKPVTNIPFGMSQPTPPPPNPILGSGPGAVPFRGAFLNPNITIQPPAQPASTSTLISKSKAKQYHIFKLFPKLPPGPVTFGRTIYSSSLVSPEFEKKYIKQMCDELQKSAKAEGSKKMSSLMGKAKLQIASLLEQQRDIKQETSPKINQRNPLEEAYHSKMMEFQSV